ncbi:hypothetical protein GH714_008083 [Hevea brasiliensis]|uniref:Late embryogenesis abundant protein LEA-2 subgroup domain-containing protein n=1 Tax=Hevea brasiliensis TaxID=3981 RepID=A0A6A6LKB0_HEVBR|nr:hypothetical protein GH714_008083 [Hevea brasiliensis]
MKTPAPLPEKPIPPPGTYVIKIPKDQVYRVPPPENAKRYEKLFARSLVAALLLLFLLVPWPHSYPYYPRRHRCWCLVPCIPAKAPKYSIDSISIKGFNLSSSAPLSPEFDVTVRADNLTKRSGLITGQEAQLIYITMTLGSATYKGSWLTEKKRNGAV